MNDLIIAFVTGLTSGGLSCMAIQGGLLTSSLAYQIEHDLNTQTSTSRNNTKGVSAAKPILIFLIAKLIAYTILGALLGWLGSMLQLNSITRAILQISIGVFIGLTALRLITNHPWLRFFSFEPPHFITRKIRKIAKGDHTWFTPFILGLMTIFIPCGVTQAMMAVAMGTGTPLMGAGIMMAFTLGTSPVFFSLAYFAAKLGARLEKAFTRIVAVIMFAFSVITIISGINLLGIPLPATDLQYSTNRKGEQAALLLAPTEEVNPIPSVQQAGLGCPCCQRRYSSPSFSPADSPTPQPKSTDQPSNKPSTVLTLYAKNEGYEPSVLIAPANQEVTLQVITENTFSCSLAFVIPRLNIQIILPQTGTTPIKIPPQKPGTVIPFSCSMGMYTGKIIFQ